MNRNSTFTAGLVLALALLLAPPAFAGGRGGRGNNTFTYNWNQSYKTDVGPNLRNLGYASLGAQVLGALLAPPPVIVAPPAFAGGGVPIGPAGLDGGLPFGPGPGTDGGFVGYVTGFEAGRAARVARAIRYHQAFAIGTEIGYADGLYGAP